MNLYSYTVRVDDGAAPNPFGGVCTLTICKPTIRRTAKIGDWIVGLGPKRSHTRGDLSNHVIYAMKVSRILTLADYDTYCTEHLRCKIPQWKTDVPFEHMVGDCIYYLKHGAFEQRAGVHNLGNVSVDERGVNALLAENDFYYFGENAVELPESLLPMRHNTQGHKVHANAHLHAVFLEWVKSGFSKGLHPRILYGQPLHRHLVRPSSDNATWTSCGKQRIEDEMEDKCSSC